MQIIKANTVFSRGLGLMFRKPLKYNQALLIELEKETIAPIHMLFVFQSIDALWLNKNKQVVYKKENIPTFKLWINPKKPAKYILELKAGKAKHIKIGTTLRI